MRSCILDKELHIRRAVLHLVASKLLTVKVVVRKEYCKVKVYWLFRSNTVTMKKEIG